MTEKISITNEALNELVELYMKARDTGVAINWHGRIIPIDEAPAHIVLMLAVLEEKSKVAPLEESVAPDAMGFPSLEAVYPDYVEGWKKWAESL